MFENKALDIGMLVHSILDITEKGPSPDKAPFAVIHARLQILEQIISKFGLNDKAWDWDLVYQNLVIPSFHNQNHEVKKIAKFITIQLFATVGEKVREMINNPELNINPLLLNEINQELDIAQSGGVPQGKTIIEDS